MFKTKVYYFALNFLFLSTFLLAQAPIEQVSTSDNLVNNPGFEEILDCPGEYGAIDQAAGWLGLRFTPDLFHACAKGSKVGVPQNYYGNQRVREGQAYAGLLLYHEKSPLEIIATNLVEPLEKGKIYEIKFKASWAKAYSNYVCNNLCVLLTNNPQEALDPSLRQVDMVIKDIIPDKDGWQTFSKKVVADEAYSFIVIGNLIGREETQLHQEQSAGYPGAYYYLDDIEVKQVADEEKAFDFIKVQGNVFDQTTLKPIEAEVRAIIAEHNDYQAYEKNDPSTGEYEFSYLEKTAYVYLEVQAQGYFSQRVKLEIQAQDTLMHDFYLEPSEVGRTFILKNLFFESGKASLDKKSTPALELLAQFLRSHVDYKVEISGYTDSEGDRIQNLELSKLRAKRVVDYLIENGFISPKRLTYVGYGPDRPIAPNNTAEGREKNRRVELRILED